jgi:GH25 family lysozyme M1 (1,4-beta-N-acetylmuramidase)
MPATISPGRRAAAPEGGKSTVRVRLTPPRARGWSLLLLGVLLVALVAAPGMAASSADIASGLVDDLRALGSVPHAAAAAGTSARPRVFHRSGIDVSHWQGRIDWRKVATDGVDFAIIKATDGAANVDPWYVRNRDRARRVGILVTAYHFARPGITGRGTRDERIRRNARIQARFFVRTADLGGSDLIPALDLERSGGLPTRELRIWTMAFLRTTEAAIGARPMVYSTASFWRTFLGDTAKVARAGFDIFWVAHWDTRRPDVPGREWLGRGWTFWQWTACGRVTGVDDCVDRNVYASTQRLVSLTIRRQRSLVR